MTFPMPYMNPSHPVTCDFIGPISTNVADRSSYTFSATPIGGPGLIVVIAQASSYLSNSLSGLTIGGVSANIIAATNTSALSNAQIAYLRVASGTQADIVVNWTGNRDRCSIAVYRIQGNTSDTPVDAQHIQNGSASSLSINLAINGNGAAVIGATCDLGNTFTLTNATADYNQSVDTTGNMQVCGAHFSKYFGASPLAITASWTSNKDCVLNGASWV